MNKISVADIYLQNSGEEVMKLIPYFETPSDFEDKGLEKELKYFPKFIVLMPKEQKIVKLLFENKPEKDWKEDQVYKTYIIFKELPNDIKSISEDNTLIVHEVGISITGKK
ncbi:MAG: hypothetical protein ACRCY7_11200 [Cetobacterium sp.]|uniref:hypothetical protein n=1 Tax=Cetobacterium sp. TaxID=2071632 RepID=UPI003F33C037